MITKMIHISKNPSLAYPKSTPDHDPVHLFYEVTVFHEYTKLDAGDISRCCLVVTNCPKIFVDKACMPHANCPGTDRVAARLCHGGRGAQQYAPDDEQYFAIHV